MRDAVSILSTCCLFASGPGCALAAGYDFDGYHVVSSRNADSGTIDRDGDVMSVESSSGQAGSDEAGSVDGSKACKPRTCEELHADCGEISDGCSTMIDCGACQAPKICGLKEPHHCDKPSGPG